MAEKKFGDRTFKADKLPASKGVHLLFRLGKIAGPALKSLSGLSMADVAGVDKNSGNQEQVLTAVGNVLGQLDPDTAQNLLIEICSNAELQMPQGHYEPVVFDAVFADKPLEAFAVAAFVIQTNFGDFFAAGSLKP